MRRSFFVVLLVIVIAVGPLALADAAGAASDLVLRSPIVPPSPWHLLVSHCYPIGHCEGPDREPVEAYADFETGEGCVATVEEITKDQSQALAMHWTFACVRTFEDLGPKLGE